MASGSASELSYHILLAKDLGYIPNAAFGQLNVRMAEMHKMLAGLIARVEGE
jgi:four helix bundle protein